MKCSNCGNEIDETTEVCSQCGAKIEKQEAKQEAKEVEILKEEKNNKSEKNTKVNVNSTSKKTFNPNEKKKSAWAGTYKSIIPVFFSNNRAAKENSTSLPLFFRSFHKRGVNSTTIIKSFKNHNG